MSKLTFALAKGRLGEKAVELLTKCGIDCKNVLEPTRQLVLSDASGDYKFIMVKPTDVPTYIARGMADVGVVGKDTILESAQDIYEMLDLNFGKCSLCLAGYPEQAHNLTKHNLRVATKYTNVAKKYYDALGINVDLIKLNGSIELAPIINMSDVILDIVESGKTLQANGLVVLKKLYDISARLVVNKVSLKLKSQYLLELVQKLQQIVK